MWQKIDRSKWFIKRSIFLQQKYIRFKNSGSDFCDYSDAYIVVKGRVSITDTNAANRRIKKLTGATGATFQINNAKLYVTVATLFINDNIKVLENIKQGFKRTTSWNKCRSEITTQTKNSNLDYLIDPILRNINRLFVLLFKNGNDDPTRNSFDEYYMSLVEIKRF